MTTDDPQALGQLSGQIGDAQSADKKSVGATENSIRMDEKVASLDRSIGHVTSTARVGLAFVSILVGIFTLLASGQIAIMLFLAVKVIDLAEKREIRDAPLLSLSHSIRPARRYRATS